MNKYVIILALSMLPFLTAGRFMGGGINPPINPTTINALYTPTLMQGTTCVAPCGVHFDATSTSDTDYPRPFHTHRFEWNFGDVGSGNWSTGADASSRNTALGPIVGHIYYSPGMYLTTLTVTAPDNDFDTKAIVVTVTDPDTQFSATNTVCIAATTLPVAGVGGCPSGADVLNAASDFDAALTNAKCAANTTKRRCLFKRGDTFISSGSVSLFDSSSPGLIAAYGTGADPIVTGPTAAPVLNYGTSWTVTGFEFQPGEQGSADYINLSAGKSYESFIDNTITGRDYHGVSTSSSGVATHNNYVCIADNTMTSEADSIAGGIFLRVQNSLVIGNSDDQNQKGTTAYNFRTIHFPHSVLSHNTFIKPGLNDNVVQIRSWGGASPPANDPNEYIVITSNYTTATNPSSGGFFKLCQTNTCDNTVTTAVNLTDVLIERNFMALETGGTPNLQYGMVQGQGGRVTIRNNVLDAQGADFSAAGSTSRLVFAHATNSTLGAGPALIDDEWAAYNNTVYFNTTGSRNLTMCDSTSIGTGHYCVGNLLDARSETGTHTSTAGTGFTSSSNNILSPGSNSFVGAPGVQGTTVATTFDIPNGSPAESTGFSFTGSTLLFNLDDFSGVNLSTPWDAGAFAAP